MSPRWSALAAVLFSAAAAAQDGGTVRSGTGYALEPVVRALPFDVKPLWVDAQHHLIGEPVNASGQPAGHFSCYSTDGGTLQLLGELASYPLSLNTPATLIAGPGVSELYILSSELYRVSCGGAPQNLGTLSLPGALAPQAPLTFEPLIYPIDGTGRVLYPAVGGLATFPAATGATATMLVPGAELTDAGVVFTPLGLETLALSPGGRLVFLAVDHPSGGTAATYRVVAREPSGTLTTFWTNTAGNSGWTPSIAWDSATSTMLIGGVKAQLVTGPTFDLLIPIGPSTVPIGSPAVPPWPFSSARMIGSYEGVPYSLVSGGLFRMTFDPAFADFDRDGLRLVEEQALGTSDLNSDSDGDGVSDYAEARRFSTSPIDAGSAPDVAVHDELVLGSSLFSFSFGLPDPGCRGKGNAGGTWAPMVCDFGCGGANCWDSDLVKHPYPAYSHLLAPPRIEGLPPEVAFTLPVSDWFATYVDTGTSRPFHKPFAAADYGQVMPLSEDSALYIETSPARHERLWRVPAGTAASFAMIDVNRPGCQLLGSAAELSSCGSAEKFFPPILDFQFAGWDPDLKSILVTVKSEQGQSLWAVTDTTITFLADFTVSLDGLTPTSILPMKEAGSRGYLTLNAGPFNLLSTVRMDKAFNAVPSPQPWIRSRGLETFFRYGFPDAMITGFLIEPPSGAAACMIRDIQCDLSPPLMPSFMTRAYSAEWVPIAPAVEKGELLFWASQRYVPGGGAIWDPRTHSGVQDYNHTWILWRLTPVGGAIEWLEERDFIARLSAADQAEVTQTKLGAITQLAVSADGLKVCLAEPGAARVWELTLDASTRILASVRLAVKAPVAGCAYDDGGALALLRSGPSAIEVGGATVPVAAISAPIGLYRLGGRWIVQAKGETARCLDAAGASSDSKVIATSLSASPGGLAYVDDRGYGFATTVERFCAGQGPLEQMSTEPFSLWSLIYETFTFRTATPVRAVMAVRPDGLAFLGGTEVLIGGLGINPPTVTNMLFEVVPTWNSINGVDRLPANDAFRTQAAVSALAAQHPREVGAMAIVPGASTKREWGYVVRPGAASVPVNPPDAGAADAGTNPPTPPKKGCGCSTGDLPLIAALLLVAVARRRAPSV